MVKLIFIQERFEAGGWWRVMKLVFELLDHPMENPDKKPQAEVTSGAEAMIKEK